MNYEFHELANIFPLLEGSEFEALATSIRTRYDTHFPIILFDGKILDGRNRYRACLEAGVEPIYSEFEGDDPLKFVIRANVERRHLNETQRAVIAARIATMRQGGDRKSSEYQSANLPIDQPAAAAMLNVSDRTVRTVKAVERNAPDLIPQMESGQMSAHEASKIAKKREVDRQRQELAAQSESVPVGDRWYVEVANLATWQTSQQFDFIITDPPYEKDYLPLYDILGQRAKEWLRPGGLAIIMCGQSYLPQIYTMLGRYLDYYWTGSYYTPGQPTPLRQRNVNTSWKPLLIYASGKYTGKIFGDTFSSEGPDKNHHAWGQSESGMLSIVKQLCLPGQSILDPFMGAGTTGLAALRQGCLFYGIDIDEQTVNLARARLGMINDKTTS